MDTFQIEKVQIIFPPPPNRGWQAPGDKSMGSVVRQLRLPEIQKIMMEFEKQSEIMDMKEEMMDDAIDDALGDDEDEEERSVMATTAAGARVRDRDW